MASSIRVLCVSAPQSELLCAQGHLIWPSPITFFIEGSAADQFVDELAALAEALNPGFWRITRSPHPF